MDPTEDFPDLERPQPDAPLDPVAADRPDPLVEALAAHAHGWPLLPLNGKVPRLADWQRAPAPTEDELREWTGSGWNLGVRTGRASGLLIVDLPPDTEPPRGLPRTVTAETGGGGRHLYYRAPDPCPGNSASLLAPHVSTFGEGGQAVYPGSVHPETRRAYRWADGLGPDDLPPARLPRVVADLLAGRPAPARDPERPAPDVVVLPHDADLERSLLASVLVATDPAPAVAALRDAVEHLWTPRHRALADAILDVAGRGDPPDATLVLAELRASDALDSVGGPAYVAELLASPALSRNAAAYAEAVRRLAEDRERAAADPSVLVTRELPEVLVPGPHTDDAGDYVEVGNDDFARTVLAALPGGVLYRRGDTPGELSGQPGRLSFRPASNERARLRVDEHVRLFQWSKRKSDTVPARQYRNCTRDLASLVLDAAVTDRHVRDLRVLAGHPVFGGDFALSEPGWNAATQIYYDEPTDLARLEPDPEAYDPARFRAILDDLVADFPFRADHAGATGGSSSRDNFYGLLLTPLLRPAIDGNVPMHLLLSPIPRAGKSLLAEQVLGGVWLGERTPARHLGSHEEEREKRILALLLEGVGLVHLDNMRNFIDSPSLASLLTATTFSVRRLGTNDSRPVPNNLVLVASGNNVRSTDELVKRTVPIWLAPDTDEPEARCDFRHPDLPAYVSEQRRCVVEALVAAVIRWRDGIGCIRRPRGTRPKGGFDRWAETVGGVLLASGYGRWRSNERAWARSADPIGEDLRALVEQWQTRYGVETDVQASALFDLSEEHGLFAQLVRGSSPHARRTSFGMRVLSAHTDAPVGEYYIRRRSSGSSSYWYLENGTNVTFTT